MRIAVPSNNGMLQAGTDLCYSLESAPTVDAYR